jgi:RNA polymerase sigma-70 factor (ECF subfamily)
MDSQSRFLALLLQHQLGLRAFIGSLVRDREARDDLFQEVALTLWNEFARYDPARPFGAWARGIAAHKVQQRWAREARVPVPFPPAAIQALLDAYDRTEAVESHRADALQRCLDQLPERSRQLLALRYEQSLSLAQIADRVCSTPDAVHKALSRLRARLHQCVQMRLAVAQRES